jgi:hypothetical protein
MTEFIHVGQTDWSLLARQAQLHPPLNNLGAVAAELKQSLTSFHDVCNIVSQMMFSMHAAA